MQARKHFGADSNLQMGAMFRSCSDWVMFGSYCGLKMEIEISRHLFLRLKHLFTSVVELVRSFECFSLLTCAYQV